MDTYRIDSGKIQFHPRHVADVVEADTWEKARDIFPIYWEITTSAACGHRCTFCSTDAIGYPADLIDTDIIINRMQEAAALGVKSVMFAGTGEPLLHKDIDHINEEAVTAGLDTAFTTNGVLLHKLETLSLAKWAKISLNAGTKDTYVKVHRTKEKDWDRVWANIARAAKGKGNGCAIGIQAVVLPENVAEMPALAARAKHHGADYLVLKPYSQATFMLSHTYEGTDYKAMHEQLKWIPERYNGDGFEVIYRENAMRRESQDHSFKRCRAVPFTWIYNKADGDVYSCSAHLMDERFKIGNLNNQTFKEIWHGEKRRQNYELMKGFPTALCRKNCRMISPNQLYHDIVEGVPHASFI